ncbi:MAG: hypothetical protein JWQ36_862 [Enterovirga sp.]|jgi:hypothetical protein|nr:hypothetical protein [Enterovirga sp.]
MHHQSELSRTLANVRAMQRDPDTLGGAHLVGLRRAISFFGIMAGFCAMLGAAAVGLPFLSSGEREGAGPDLVAHAAAAASVELFGADQRLFAPRLPR